ncbi:MAG TPA: hypothetical protein VFG42_10180 [Baekduia sp.]|uniref:hypothetical protein n=1 Tax=Baekduia sp. TaxID=2600305 RepID=UPI002D79B533|nr:hypothetical protein [Baekduia sp.]HET6507148.1 hypothetical protein [Baekduia sp.]
MEPKRRLRDMTPEELRGMTAEEAFATFDLEKIFLTEHGGPWSPKPFGPRVYERWRRRFFRLLHLLHLRREGEIGAEA